MEVPLPPIPAIDGSRKVIAAGSEGGILQLRPTEGCLKMRCRYTMTKMKDTVAESSEAFYQAIHRHHSPTHPSKGDIRNFL
jgi:hypothetical protein